MFFSQSLDKDQVRVATAALLLLLGGSSFLAVKVSMVTLLLVGIPGLFAYGFWYFAYLRQPTAPTVLVPVFLVTVAGFFLHLIEEYIGNYPQAISRLFGFAWTERAFFITVACLAAGLTLATLGILHRQPIAGFMAILFITTRFAEMALFVFPFIEPVIKPLVAGPVSERIGHSFVADMPNYYYPLSGHYYFPGMFTVLLPLVPAAVAVYRLWKYDASRKGHEGVEE